MTNFLDQTALDETDLDLGIFDEEDPETEEQELEQVDDVVVDKKTGEIVAEGTEEVLGDNIKEITIAEDTKDIIAHMDEVGLTDEKIHIIDANDKPMMTKKTTRPRTKAPVGPTGIEGAVGPGPCPTGEVGPQGQPGTPEGNPIRKAMSRMEYKYVKDLEPHTISFNDCNFTEFNDEINEAQRIITIYYEEGIDANLGRAEHDLGKLSAIMCRIGAATGYIQGNGEAFDRIFKNVRSACYTELKEMKSDDDMRISDKDIENVAQVLAGTQLKGISKVEIQGKMVMNFWFSLRKFIDILEGQIVRNRSESKTEVHAEAAAHRPDPDEQPTQHNEPDPIEEALEF